MRVAPAAVLTAAHCIDLDAPLASVLPATGPAVSVVGVGLVAGMDVALLELEAALDGPVAPFGQPAQPGDAVSVHGRCAPAAKSLTVGGAMFGLVIGLGTPSVCPGDSGGGWYDRAGRLVGITSARSLGDRQAQSAAVDVVRLGLGGLIGD